MVQRFFEKMFVTWFGLGKVPIAPGTAGSIGAIPLCWLMTQPDFQIWHRFIFATGWTAIAILTSMQDQKVSQIKDPSYIVIDEVAGMLWSCFFIGCFYIPQNYKSILVAFIAFRILDVVKPFPANYFDKSSKFSTTAFRQGFNIVMDDVIAGFYACACVAIFFHPRVQALTDLLN